MRRRDARIVAAVLAVVLVAGLAPEAAAFFPIGGFDSFGLLRYAKWPFFEFDTNNDGEITPEEGLSILIEGGKSGFTDEEQAVVLDALDVWEDVSSSYASFRFDGTVIDPILTGIEPDFLSVIAMQVTADDGDRVVADPPDVIAGEVAYPVLGVTFILFAIEDEILDVAGQSYYISAGTMIDVDIVIDAVSHRPVDGAAPLADLHGVLVHELGHFLGLGHTPLNNLRGIPSAPGAGDIAGLVENEVFWLTAPDGTGGFIGVTPTMFPIVFSTEEGSGSRFDGGGDLAPDDISAISWLYPRGSQSNYFSIEQETRTRTREGTGLPSVPLPGAHIVAWCDQDNDINTPRIPLFSTMAGLYNYTVNTQLEGRFELLGLWKQIEVSAGGGALFNPTYTLTCNPINGTGLERQAPPTLVAEEFDSLQGPGSFSVTTRSTYINAYTSEVFNEVENVIDVSNKDAGTALVWSFERGYVISADSAKTVPEMLPRNIPMFGDPNNVCLFNMVSEGTGGDTTGTTGILAKGPGKLRHFRDAVLLESALGAAAVDLYYHAAPSAAQFLIANDGARTVFREGVHLMYWFIGHSAWLLPAAGLSLLACLALARRRLRAWIAGLTVLAAVFGGLPAQAEFAYVEEADLVADSEVLIGTILSAEARWAAGGRIRTDVVLEIEEKIAGRLNKGSTVSFSVTGGRIGGFVMYTSALPTFTAGENVRLFLQEEESGGYRLHGGLLGKATVLLDKATGEKYLQGGSEVAERMLAGTEKALQEDGEESVEDEEAADGRIPLDAYIEYIREIVREQKRTAE